MPEGNARFDIGDTMLWIDGKDRQYLLVMPKAEEKIKVRDETFSGEALAGLSPGKLFMSPMGRRYLVMRPSLEEVVMNMPRQAQVIYPKDLALMLMWGDVGPGMRVIEVGCGHGALTMTLMRALGPEGHLTSFDLREDHLNRTRKNLARYLGAEVADRWEMVQGDPSQEEGFGGRMADRVFSDMPEPWTILEAVAQSLPDGGIWCAYVPTVMQMAQLMEALHADPAFCLDKGFETLQRFWHVKSPSVRPSHNMKAHTGFIITCRRRAR